MCPKRATCSTLFCYNDRCRAGRSGVTMFVVTGCSNTKRKKGLWRRCKNVPKKNKMSIATTIPNHPKMTQAPTTKTLPNPPKSHPLLSVSTFCRLVGCRSDDGVGCRSDGGRSHHLSAAGPSAPHRIDTRPHHRIDSRPDDKT